MRLRNRRTTSLAWRQAASGPPPAVPEWLERVRLTVEHEAPIMQAVMMRAIDAVLEFNALSEDSALNAAAAPTNFAVLLRALSSGGVLEDLKSVEPLAPAFIRGIEDKRQLVAGYGGPVTAERVGDLLGITPPAVASLRRH